jgi:hypothetical protein
MMKMALLDDVVAAFDFHAVIAGVGDFQAFEMPVIAISGQQHCAIGGGVRQVTGDDRVSGGRTGPVAGAADRA